MTPFHQKVKQLFLRAALENWVAIQRWYCVLLKKLFNHWKAIPGQDLFLRGYGSNLQGAFRDFVGGFRGT